MQPPRRGGDCLALARAEIVPGAGDADEIDPRILPCDPLEDGERTELILVALHDERRAGRRGERRLVARPRAFRRRDGMAENDERVRRLLLGEESADAATERATDERDALAARRSQVISCRTEIFDLRDVVLARARSARPEGDRLRRDAESLER